MPARSGSEDAPSPRFSAWTALAGRWARSPGVPLAPPRVARKGVPEAAGRAGDGRARGGRAHSPSRRTRGSGATRAGGSSRGSRSWGAGPDPRAGAWKGPGVCSAVTCRRGVAAVGAHTHSKPQRRGRATGIPAGTTLAAERPFPLTPRPAKVAGRDPRRLPAHAPLTMLSPRQAAIGSARGLEPPSRAPAPAQNASRAGAAGGGRGENAGGPGAGSTRAPGRDSRSPGGPKGGGKTRPDSPARLEPRTGRAPGCAGRDGGHPPPTARRPEPRPGSRGCSPGPPAGCTRAADAGPQCAPAGLGVRSPGHLRGFALPRVPRSGSCAPGSALGSFSPG